MVKKLFIIILSITAITLISGILTIPSPSSPYSMAIFSADGQLLNARLAQDEQWRFQATGDLPDKYVSSLILFEDRHFYLHPGVNIISLFRALKQNIKSNKIVSGGSTITMQAIRMRRGTNKPRTFLNKILEIYWALSLELRYSKKQILSDYAARAPFGTNVVGFEAACWRYFEKPGSQLSWAEAACLAILPNSPALIHPGRNRDLLKRKRDDLLLNLFLHNKIDSISLQLAKLEPIPENPKPIPNLAPHALDYLIQTMKEPGTLQTSIDYSLQNQMNELARNTYIDLSTNQIHNLAILISDTRTGKTLAYIGNPSNTSSSLHVDHIQSARSTGSIMKPLLYAAALSRGMILPKTLLRDVPTVIDGFQPKNFSLNYSGTTPADQALIQSLNIPFVLLLKQYGLEQFHHDLKLLGLHTIDKPPSHYGLSLILGGAEASLWDLTGAYASLGRVLLHYPELENQYDPSDIHALTFNKLNSNIKSKLVRESSLINAASIYSTFETLKKLQRPDDAGLWQTFTSNQAISWKTGTSYGFRDAWAIGINAQYTIGIWVGNSSGEGRPSLLGAKVAAPILFDVLSRLPHDLKINFEPPLDELNPIIVCHTSGMKAVDLCPIKDTVLYNRFSNQTMTCNYHQQIWINTKNGLRVNQQCASSDQMQSKIIFNLPPLEEYYYSTFHPDYEKMPRMDPSCESTGESNPMNMIQPEAHSIIYLPVDQNGLAGKVIFKLAHRQPETTVYWHLDESYIGSTRTFHELAVNTVAGVHVLTVLDSAGHELKCEFKVLTRK